MTPDQLEDVKADIYAEPWKDPQLFPDLLHKAITELGELATGDHSNCTPGHMCQLPGGPEARRWAADLLRRMQGRARSGVPFGEPAYGDLGPTNPKDV